MVPSLATGPAPSKRAAGGMVGLALVPPALRPSLASIPPVAVASFSSLLAPWVQRVPTPSPHSGDKQPLSCSSFPRKHHRTLQEKKNCPNFGWRMRSGGPLGDRLLVTADSLHFTLKLLPGLGKLSVYRSRTISGDSQQEGNSPKNSSVGRRLCRPTPNICRPWGKRTDEGPHTHV